MFVLLVFNKLISLDMYLEPPWHACFCSTYIYLWWYLQGAAEVTPTFQRGITNIWYAVSPNTFYFPNITKHFLFPKCRYHKVFLL
jgi:hypothetical protein